MDSHTCYQWQDVAVMDNHTRHYWQGMVIMGSHTCHQWQDVLALGRKWQSWAAIPATNGRTCQQVKVGAENI